MAAANVKTHRERFAPEPHAQAASNHGSPLHGSPLLDRLLESSIVHLEDWEALPLEQAEVIARADSDEMLLELLVRHLLLTKYQAARVRDGASYGLILGNYRVLDRLGAGGMGVVYKGEHLRLRRPVAIKVLPVKGERQPRALLRFCAEMRAVAQLHHQHIVCAIDAGNVEPDEPDNPVLHYFVMEYLQGVDLEKQVETEGPLPISQACELICQVASALIEANKHNLVHRDIKPSNILVTPSGQAKLLDFGLVHHFRSRLTDPQTTLGTIDYMAPEQAKDAGAVDIRADIYGLGGTLYWCLCGKTPFNSGNATCDLVQRLTQEPPSVRGWRPEIPGELDNVLQRMMAVHADNRYQTPEAVIRALMPFRGSPSHFLLESPAPRQSESGSLALAQRILLVDDDRLIRQMCRLSLEAEGFQCEEAENGVLALEALDRTPYDLVTLDIDMPEMSGNQVLEHLQQHPPSQHLKIMMISGRANPEEMARMLLSGADDYLAKPFAVVEYVCRVKAALRLKSAQDRTDLLQTHLLAINAELEQHLTHQSSDLLHMRTALVDSLAKVIELRGSETSGHLRRCAACSRILAEDAARFPSLKEQIDQNFIQTLERCAPLHDLGNIGLPDHILFKPGLLDPEERLVMQSHTVLGAGILGEVAKQHSYSLAFLSMAIDVARHHHERYDGKGYPDRLAGASIPLAARLLTIVDAYDSLRRRHQGRPPLGHSDALKVMEETAPGQLDPLLMQAFRRCAPQFEKIFHSVPE